MTSTQKILRWFSALATAAVLLAWMTSAIDVEPFAVALDGSRYHVLRQAVTMADQGYLYQLDPGVPMETQWEDPGLPFLTSTWVAIKHAIGLGGADVAVDPYFVEAVLVFAVLLLLFVPGLFDLPPWFYPTVPIATFLIVAPWWQLPWTADPNSGLFYNHLPYGLLYLSVSDHWAKVLTAIWSVAVVLQIREWYVTRPLAAGLWPRQVWIRLFVFGIVYGVLASIRKDVLVPALISVAGAAFMCALPSLLPRRARGTRTRAVIAAALTCVTVFAGVQTFLGSIRAAWLVRDQLYTIKPMPRIFGHPTWHVLYISLGFVPNDLGIKWDDGVGWEHVRRLPQNAGIQYGTAEHERASRALLIDTIRAHPDLLWRNIVAKRKFLWDQQHQPLQLALWALLALLVVSFGYRSVAPLYAINWLACLSIPILVYPDRDYYLDLLTTGVMIVSAVGVMTTVVTGRVLAGLAGWIRRPGPRAKPGRAGLRGRIFNEGEFGPKAIARAVVLLSGFLLTRAFERSRLMDTRLGRRLYYEIYAAGKRLLDRDKVELLRGMLKPGDVVVDVGGAFGFFTEITSLGVGPGGRVIVFEPDPRCISFITDLVERRHLTNVELVEAAAWWETGTLRLHLCPENRGENSVFESPIHDAVVDVPACTVDDRVGNAQVSFVKIDVQGAETAVIRGMRDTIRRSPQLQIICECSPSDLALGGVSLDAFLGTIRDAGLAAFRLDRHPAELVTSAADLADLGSGSYRQCDLLCRPVSAS